MTPIMKILEKLETQSNLGTRGALTEAEFIALRKYVREAVALRASLEEYVARLGQALKP